jgi:prepilin-type processing-associated H-X9-DG protein
VQAWRPSAGGADNIRYCYALNYANTLGSVAVPGGIWGGNCCNASCGWDTPRPYRLAVLNPSQLATIWMIRDHNIAGFPEFHRQSRNAVFFDGHVGRLDLANNPL